MLIAPFPDCCLHLPFYRGFKVSIHGERSGIVVEHLTPNREVLGLISTGGTVLCILTP